MKKTNLPKHSVTSVTAAAKASVKESRKVYHWPSPMDYPPVTLNRLQQNTTLLREGFVKGYEARQPEITRLEKRIQALEKQMEAERQALRSHAFGD